MLNKAYITILISVIVTRGDCFARFMLEVLSGIDVVVDIGKRLYILHEIPMI